MSKLDLDAIEARRQQRRPKRKRPRLSGYSCVRCGVRVEAQEWHTCSDALLDEDLPALIARARELETTTYCAYCGYKVTIADPDSAEIVAEHIRTCEKHPLGRRVRELENIEIALESEHRARLRAERLIDELRQRARELEGQLEVQRQHVRDLEFTAGQSVTIAIEAERQRCLEAVGRVKVEDLIRHIAWQVCATIRDAIKAEAEPRRGDLIIGRCVHRSQPVICHGECDTNCPIPVEVIHAEEASEYGVQPDGSVRVPHATVDGKGHVAQIQKGE